MDKTLFQGLLEGVRQMGAHMRGENVPGARVTALFRGPRALHSRSALGKIVEQLSELACHVRLAIIESRKHYTPNRS